MTKYSERAKRNMRNQLHLKLRLYKSDLQYMRTRDGIYQEFRNHGMKGLAFHQSKIWKRIKKITRHIDRLEERIAKLRVEGAI